MKRKDKNLILLSEYATKFKIEKILAQYMEVLDEKKCNESKSNNQ